VSKLSKSTQVKELTSKLEEGIKELFSSDKYADYLKTMSRFHTYSTRNTMLIYMQKPSATYVAGFGAWQTKFKRHVKKGEKAIKILAPTPFVIREKREQLDPETRLPVLDEEGLPVIEYTELRLARFKAVNVFDVSQTDGEPLPNLVQTLSGDVEQYEAFMDALRAVSPLPIVMEPLPEGRDGECVFGDRIILRAGMSEIQTVCAAIHEITHAKLHDIESLRLMDETATPKDRRTEEVEAESISYAVCQHFGIETGANSFGYIAQWSKTRELKELNASLDTIRKTVADLIETVDGKFQEIIKERGITLDGEEQIEFTEPNAMITQTTMLRSLKPEEIELTDPDWSECSKGEATINWYVPIRFNVDKVFSGINIETSGNGDYINLYCFYKPVADKVSLDIVYVSATNAKDCNIEVELDSMTETNLHAAIKDALLDCDIYKEFIEGTNQQGYMPIRADMEIDTEAEALLPDPSIGISEMSAYGYAQDGMLPLMADKALELWDADHPVYRLYPDDTEGMIFDRDEIADHDGIFGIDKSEWKASVKFSKMQVATRNSEGSLEAELLHGSGDRFGIYQISDDIDEVRNFRFTPMRELEAHGLSIDRANYKLVYTAPFTMNDNLDQIFTDFNNEDCPIDFTGRSISVSDIIVLKQSGDVSSHYVDRVGFVELDAFLGEERQSAPAPSTELPTYSQVGNKSKEYEGTTVAELEADVKAGKSISLLDLSKAVHAEQMDGRGHDGVSKAKLSLMERLEAGKHKVAQQNKSDIQRSSNLEV